MDLVEGSDRDNQEEEVSLDSIEEAEREEEDKTISMVFDKVGGSISCWSIPKNEFVAIMEAMGTDHC